LGTFAPIDLQGDQGVGPVSPRTFAVSLSNALIESTQGDPRGRAGAHGTNQIIVSDVITIKPGSPKPRP